MKKTLYELIREPVVRDSESLAPSSEDPEVRATSRINRWSNDLLLAKLSDALEEWANQENEE